MTATRQSEKRLRIDPRIKERRNKVARLKGRRRLYVILAIFALIGSYFLVRALLRTSLFAVRKIEIVGASHYPDSVLASQSGIPIGFPLTAVNPEKVAKRIEQLPWDGAATVRKKWPNTLEISVKERSALAVVPQSPKTELLVDSTGRVLATQPSSNGKWLSLCLMGSIPSSKALAQPNSCQLQNVRPGSFVPSSFAPLLKVASALHADPAAGFSEVAISTSGEIDGRLANGLAVRFGPDTQLSQKLRALQLILTQASTKGYSTVDLRVPQEPVLSNW